MSTPVTLVSHRDDRTITKVYHLDPQTNELTYTPGGIVYDADIERHDLESLEQFGSLIKSLQPNQALIYGVPRNKEMTRIMSSRRLNEYQKEKGGTDMSVGARNKQHFHWGDDGGIMMIDYDPGKDDEVLDRDGLVDMVRTAVPGLEKAEMLWIPSASSMIFNGETGEQIYGIRGQRLYFRVEEAGDIPRAGKTLFERLWLAGYGRIEISKIGSLLVRGPCDTSVWSQERLDFAAGSSCQDPLVQRRGEPVIIEGETKVVDTMKAIRNLSTQDRSRLNQMISTAKKEAKPHASVIRNDYIRMNHEHMLEPKRDGDDTDDSFMTLSNCLQTNQLPSNFLIQVIVESDSEDTEIRQVSVGTILDFPGDYEGLQCLDPLEPDYRGGQAVGMIYLSGVRPLIHSFAHGGRNFILMRQKKSIVLTEGGPLENREAICRALREVGGVYERGNSPVYVHGDKVRAFEVATIEADLGRYFRVVRPMKVKGEIEYVPSSLKPNHLRDFLSMNGGRGLPQLDGVSSIPVVAPDGRVIQDPGYYEDLNFLYLPRSSDPICPPIPSHPTDEEIERSANMFRDLFKECQFSDENDLAIAVSAMISACCRPFFDRAPAYTFEAPVSSSGKTYIGQVVATMATGEEAPVTSAPEDNAEWKKSLLAHFMTGDARDVVFIDNVRGLLNSTALEAFLTADKFSGRVLGETRTVSFKPRCTVIVTGNNMALNLDSSRRFLRCILAPKEDAVDIVTKQYSSCPLTKVKNNRNDYAQAACILLRAAKVRKITVEEKLSGYPEWSDMILPALKVGGFNGSPIQRVLESRREAQEASGSGDLFQALWDTFGDKMFTAADLIEKAKADALVASAGGKVLRNSQDSEVKYNGLDEALEKVSEKRPHEWTSKSVGWTLSKRKGQNDGGLTLKQEATGGKKTGRGTRYYMVRDVTAGMQ